jgi:hypothetical protein
MNILRPFSLLPPRDLGIAALTSIVRPSSLCWPCCTTQNLINLCLWYWATESNLEHSRKGLCTGL